MDITYACQICLAMLGQTTPYLMSLVAYITRRAISIGAFTRPAPVSLMLSEQGLSQAPAQTLFVHVRI